MPKRKNREAKVKARSKRPLFTFVNDSGKTVKLSLKQKLFGEYYLKYRGNGVQAARAAGYKGSPVTLSAIAYENLRKPQITDYIRFLLKKEGLTDESIDKELLIVIRQDANLAAKIRGIQEYNKVGGRIKERVEHGVDERLEAVLDRVAKILPK